LANGAGLLGLALIAGVVAPLAVAQPPQAAPQSNVEHLVAALDNPEYFAREHAMRQLRAVVTEGPQAAQVAGQLQRLSFDPKVSYEAQLRLAEILDDVPAVKLGKPEQITDTDAADIVAAIASDRFAQRQSAIRRLEWLLENDQNVVPLLVALKARLADTKLTPAGRHLLETQHALARGYWLMAPPDRCVMPPVPESEIAQMLTAVATPATDDASFLASASAVRNLEDLLAREEYRVSLSERLAAELERAEDPAVRTMLTDLVDLTKPAMVAEIWSALRYVNVGGGMMVTDFDPESLRLSTCQYLHVGVPQIPEGAERATHFDRCDDKVANCVSGNTLTPGEYPVHTAFAHPNGQNILFHLVNLPTPRRRLLYEHLATRDPSIRFREMSQRTCDAFLSGQRKLTDTDIGVLLTLDRAVVDQFAADFLQQVKDEPLENRLGNMPGGRVSQHGAICYVLARRGDKKSAEAILDAVAKKRILPPDARGAHDMPYIALLSIAKRDVWPDADKWLTETVERERPLVTTAAWDELARDIEQVDEQSVDNPQGQLPDASATAAAVLAQRLGLPVESLGLVEQRDELCMSLGLLTYRFESSSARTQAAKRLKSQLALRPKAETPAE
jgi:hypothetical protein